MALERVETGQIYAFIRCSGETIDWTGELALVAARCVEEGRRPVVLCEPTATLSYAACFGLAQLGGRAMAAYEDAIVEHESHSAYRDLLAADAGQAYGVVPDDYLPQRPFRWAAEISLSLRHPASLSVSLGSSVRMLCAAFDLPLPQWGDFSPVRHRWDETSMTKVARSRMPHTTHVTLGERGDPVQGRLSLRRTPDGLHENLDVLVLVPGATADSAPAWTGVLESVAEKAKHPQLGIVAAAAVDPDGGKGLRPRVPGFPVALLLGPRPGKIAAELPAEGLSGIEHSWVGPARLPSRLVRFTGTAPPWESALALAQAWGPEGLTQMSGLLPQLTSSSAALTSPQGGAA